MTGLAERIVEATVVRPGDKLIVRVTGDLPLDPYSSTAADEQVRNLAKQLKDLLGESIGVVVIGGSRLELTVLRAGVGS